MLSPRTPRRPAPARKRRRVSGFTLVEMVIALALVAVIAAVISTQAVGRLGTSQAATLARSLQGVATAIRHFRSDVTRYPARIQDLAVLPAGARDSCGRVLPTSLTVNWRGPYLNHSVPATGIPVGTSVVNDTIVRTPGGISTTNAGTLTIRARVDRKVAEELEATFDGTVDAAAGSIQWTTTGEAERVVLRYIIPVSGC